MGETVLSPPCKIFVTHWRYRSHHPEGSLPSCPFGEPQNYLFSLKRMLWLCSKMAIRDFTSYSMGFLKLIPSGKPATASEPGSFRNLSYGKGTTLLFPTASPGEGAELHTDGHPAPPPRPSQAGGANAKARHPGGDIMRR